MSEEKPLLEKAFTPSILTNEDKVPLIYKSDVESAVRQFLYSVEVRIDDYFVNLANSADDAGYPETADTLMDESVTIKKIIKKEVHEVFGEVEG